MYIIKITPYENMSRPPIQTWSGDELPNGYAECPEEYIPVFYSTDPAGFVNITVENNTVTSMTVCVEAYEAWKAAHPDPEPEPEPTRDPTADEILNALLGVTE